MTALVPRPRETHLHGLRSPHGYKTGALHGPSRKPSTAVLGPISQPCVQLLRHRSYSSHHHCPTLSGEKVKHVRLVTLITSVETGWRIRAGLIGIAHRGQAPPGAFVVDDLHRVDTRYVYLPWIRFRSRYV
jgi:hypothetical protein